MTPEESLELIEEERRRIGRRTRVDPALLQGVWAVAWFVGFGTAYLAYGPHRVVPGWLGPTVAATLIVVAFVATLAYSVRADAGIRGAGRTAAAMYGWAWTIGFAGLTAVNIALVTRAGIDGRTVTLLWASTSLLLAGVLHLAGGAMFGDSVLYATGVWTVLCAAGAVFAGVPGAFLVLSLAGGGGFAVLAVAHRWRRR